MHPDHEIVELEQRIARRRRELDELAHYTARQTMRKLASPVALISVAALGFLVGGGLRRRHPQKESAAGKKTGIAGLLMTGAMWFIRARFGSPMALAQYVLAKVNAARRSSPPSPYDDSGEAEAGGRRLHSRPAQIYR
jgi:hypothetical protein